MLPTTLEGCLQLIEQIDEKHSDGHSRLRAELANLADKVESNFTYHSEREGQVRQKVTTLAAKLDTPIDATRLVLTPKIVAVIVTFAVTIAGGVWASTSGLRSDVRDILTRMDAQQQAARANADVQKVTADALKTAVEDMRRRQELQQYEIQNLKEAILTGKVKIQEPQP